ncbi:MAG: hypothetical protein WBC44_12400 [Planctomycetaceae bacterium]
MASYLVLSLALLGAEPAAGCDDCGTQPQPTQQSQAAGGITDDCYCPQFIEGAGSPGPGPNFWVVYKFPPNSGMETDCFLWEEVVIYDTLAFGECDSQCSHPNCWLGGSSQRSADGEKTASQDAEQPQAGANVAKAARPPSLRLTHKKRVQAGTPAFEFPVEQNVHIDFREEAIRSRFVKIADRNGATFTWLRLFDLSPKEEGRRGHHAGHEIEPPAGNVAAETVEISSLQPVKIDPVSRNFPGEVVDGFYRLRLSDPQHPEQVRNYFVRMHSRLPEEKLVAGTRPAVEAARK